MILQVGNGSSLNWMALSPDGTRLVTTDFENTTLVWDVRDGAIVARIPGIKSDLVQFSRDNRQLLCNGDDRTPPMICDIATERSMPAPKDIAAFGRFAVDGKYWEYRTPYRFDFCLSCRDFTRGKILEYMQIYDYGSRPSNFLNAPAVLQLRDPASGAIERTLPAITGELLDISRDNHKAVTLTGTPRMEENIRMLGTDNPEFILWDLESGKEITRLKGVPGFVVERKGAVFSPDGSKFAAAVSSYTAPPEVGIWDTGTGALLRTLNTPSTTAQGEAPPPIANFIDVLAFSADGRQLAAGGLDSHAVVWDVTGGQVRHVLKTENNEVEELAFTPDGARLFTASETDWRISSIQLWDLQTGTPVRTFAGTLQKPDPIMRVPRSVTPDGQLLALGSPDRIDVWDMRAGSVRRQLPLPAGKWPFSLALHPNGTMLLAALYDTTGKDGDVFTVWDLATGTVKKTIPASLHVGGDDSTHKVAFNPEGTYAAGCSGNTVLLWDTHDWTVVKRLEENLGVVDDLAFSPVGLQLAWISMRWAGSDAETEYRVDIRDIPGGQRDTMTGKQGATFSGLAFSPNGKWLATRTREEIMLWNCRERKEGKGISLPGDYFFCRHLAFTADSRHLLATSRGHLVYCGLDTGTVKSTALQDTDAVYGITLTNTGNELITWGLGGTAQLWDLGKVTGQQTAQPRATLQTFENNLWLITTPAGYFDCAPGVAKAIRWKQGERSYPYDKFEKEYHRTGLVQKSLKFNAGK